MPLITPPTLSVQLYAKSATGETFRVSTNLPGATGPVGPIGESTIIVSAFGPAVGGTGTPATLPPDGLLPAGFTSTGSAQYQMILGQSLYYDAPGDPEDGFLFQFVSDIAGVPWLSLGLIEGAKGVLGPIGPVGPTGPQADDVNVGPDEPASPPVELWYDTDDNRILGPAPLPPGGLAGNFLMKASAIDGDVRWTGVNGNSVHIGDNAGYLTAGGGGIFKKSGAGIVLRRHNNNAVIPIENNDGVGTTNIVVANGTVEMAAPLKWPGATADKVYLYPSSTPGTNSFGLGVDSGTTAIFVSSSSSKVAFRIGGHDGTEYASFTQATTTVPPLAASVSDVVWINGFSGYADFRWDAATVTMRLRDVRCSPNVEQSTTKKLFTLPAGVPVPYQALRSSLVMTVSADIYFTPPTDWAGMVFFDVRGDGVWVQTLDYCVWYTDRNASTTITWVR